MVQVARQVREQEDAERLAEDAERLAEDAERLAEDGTGLTGVSGLRRKP